MPRPILIADCALNWDGMDGAKRMVLAAKEAGFDLAAFQLYGNAQIAAIADEAARERVRERRIHQNQAAMLCRFGKQIGLPVFFTVMSPSWMDTIRYLGVGFLKIRCQDEAYADLWAEFAHAEWKGTIFYSTTNPKAMQVPGRVPLFCIPKHPAAAGEYDALFAGEPITGRIGVSLHLPDPELWMRCWVEEATAIESQVMLDDCPSAVNELTSVRFADIATWIREAKSEVRHADSELDGQLDHERRILERVPSVDCGSPKVKKWDIFKKRRRNRDWGRPKSGT